MGFVEFLEQGDDIVLIFENGKNKYISKSALINYINIGIIHSLEELDEVTYMGKYKHDRIKINIF